MSTRAAFASLTRAEAEQRAALLEVVSYDLALDLDTGEETFTSTATVHVRSQGGETWLDVRPVALRGISLDGVPLDVDRLERGRYPLRLDDGEHRLVVETVMAYRNDGEGLHRSTDAADGRDYVYGMNFMEAAPTVYACFDQPDLKAPYTLHVRAPEDWVVVGNGRATRVAAGTWELATTPPLSTYFVTLVAGPYHLVTDEHDGIALGLSARASIAEHLDREADEILTLTRQSLDELHRLFGIRYAFGDYHQAFVPEFNAGAMENPGCITFRDPLVFTSRVTRGQRVARATTIAHEMAHQWFGDLVTPVWWDDLWLNESFAEYLGNRVTADATTYADAWEDVAQVRRPWGLVADQRPSTHPVAGNGATTAAAALQDFDGISYAKGSAVLAQLNTLLGDEAFFGGAVDLMTRRRFGNVTMAELFAAWEQASGRDLSEVTAQWLRTAGPDLLALDRPGGRVLRTPPEEHPAERTHVLEVARERDGALVVAPEPVEVSAPTTPLDVVAPGSGAVLLDPHVRTWAATVLDEETVAALPRLLPATTDPLLRAGVWNALRTTVRRGLVDPRAVVDVVVAAPPVQDTSGATLGWVERELLALAPDDAAVRVHEAVLAVAQSVDESDPAGAEEGLAAHRSAIDTAGPGQVDLLRGWREEIEGAQEPDHALRWRVLVRLATLGAVDRADLDRALADHRDAETSVEHTKALASLPDASAKAWAWSRFTGEVDVANYDLEAAGIGMWRRGQEELTAPYVERYFAELPGTAEVRSGWVLAETASDFFPRTALDPATLERARALAADDGLEASLRRRVADEADDLACRLRTLERWPR